MKICRQCGNKYEPLTEKQEDCSENCLANRFDTFTRKTRALARILAGTMGYRSMSEVRFAARLKRERIPFEYEADKLKYQYPPQNYVVDFTLSLGVSGKILIEYKGKLDAQARKKMRAVKVTNPDLDIRFVFEKPNNFLYKGAKMRYWEWAEKHGFKWYDVKNTKQLRLDLTEETKNERRTRKKTKALRKA